MGAKLGDSLNTVLITLVIVLSLAIRRKNIEHDIILIHE